MTTNGERLIYLDNAATSWPKPEPVLVAMRDFLERAGGNPGRSGHRLSVEAGRIVYRVREQLATLFQAPDPLGVIFTLNATHAINLVLRGLLRPGDHVVTTAVEHNAVMRPLRALERQGVSVTVASCEADGTLDPASIAASLRPETRLVAMTHASNVVGTILPVTDVSAIAQAHGVPLLLDAAQTAGALPISMAQLGIDYLAFTGHKSLLGPPGVGGLVLGSGANIEAMEPLVCGGTGSRSEWEEQPDFLPDRYESGTPNGAGIAGLGAALSWLTEHGMESTHAHEMALTQALIEGLRSVPGVRLYGTRDTARSLAVLSITVAGRDLGEVGLRLDEDHGVLARVGLHCAPAAHRTIGTFPDGTVRLAPGVFTTAEDIAIAVAAIGEVAAS